jgi:hypothetical protein
MEKLRFPWEREEEDEEEKKKKMGYYRLVFVG